MKIVEISSRDIQSISQFHGVVDVVYANDTKFIPYLTDDIDAIFNKEINQNFKKGVAQRWVVLGDDKRPVGRIAAFYVRRKGKSVGGWGFFECINDLEVAKEMIETAENWLQVHKCQRIQAPINFGDRDTFWGLMIENKGIHSYQENYHPVYYKEMLTSLGYATDFEQSTYEITDDTFNKERFERIAERTLGNSEYEYRCLEFGKLQQFATDFTTVYKDAWSFHEDFEPLEVSKVLERFKKMKPAIIPSLVVFAYHKNVPIGFYVNILELNTLFKEFGGTLNLVNKLKFMMRKNTLTRIKGVVFGIVPSHQNKGVEAGLIMKTYGEAKKLKKITSMELAWIGDFNPKMISMLTAMGAVPIKKHITYFKEIV